MNVAQLGSSNFARSGAPVASHPASIHYQMLVSHLDGHGLSAQRPKVIGFVSCASGSGVSTIAANLAAEVARGGFERVLLFDANLVRPRVHKLFSVSSGPGLVQAMGGNPAVDECIQRSSVSSLHLLTSGVERRTGARRFRLRSFTRVLDEVRDHYELMVVDLPPATKLSISYMISALLDGIVLVVEAERNQVDDLQRVKRRLISANAQLLGVVLNKCRQLS
jgi:capsular exopolysaccharide synthesis family protein